MDYKNISGAAPPPPLVQNYEVCEVTCEEWCIQGFVGVTLGKEPIGRPRRRWGDNIKMDLQEVACGGMDWIDLV